MPIAKPTDEILWAETPNVPGDVADPTTKRSAGWQFKDPPPSNAFNYLLRAAGRFCAFAADKFDSTGEKLTLGADHAELEVATDTSLAVLWDFVGATINTVRATVFQADAFAVIGSLDPSIILRTYGEGTYTEDASNALLDFTHNDSGTFTLAADVMGASNVARVAGLVSLVGNGSDVAAPDPVTPVLGYNVGSVAIVTPGTRRRLRITLTAGQLAHPGVVVTAQTNAETRDITATIVAVNNVANPAQIDVVLRDNAGVDVLADGALISGQNVLVYLTGY